MTLAYSKEAELQMEMSVFHFSRSLYLKLNCCIKPMCAHLCVTWLISLLKIKKMSKSKTKGLQ